MRRYLLGLTAFCAPFLAANTARASIESCGNIHVEANAECQVRAGVECEAWCEPVRFEAQCAGDLAVRCQGECNASASVECTGSCEASCMSECEANPGTFDCEGSCFARCEGSCEAQCGTDDECFAQCQGACDAECNLECEATPPTVDCEIECAASCEGACRAEANLDCQIDCQAPQFPECQAELEGGCRADCETQDGALFCDGQYVDHGNNLEECIDALRAIFGIEVSGYAEGECSGNMCSGEAGFTCACTQDPTPGRTAGWMTLAFIGLFGAYRRGRRG